MKPIIHRGIWNHFDTPNSIQSLQRSLAAGIALETDIRSFHRSLFLASHSITNPNNSPRFGDFLAIASSFPNVPIFLNIKEDGLLPLLQTYQCSLERLTVVFRGMSIPELVLYSQVFPSRMLCTRVSEYEPHPSALQLCDWIWVDCFHKEFTHDEIQKLTKKGKKLVFVSPELHGRDPLPFWRQIKQHQSLVGENHYLCTHLLPSFQEEFCHD